MNAARPVVAQLTRAVDLAPLFGPHSPFIGFTSATGGGWGDHEVLSWEFFGGSLPANSFTADYDGNDQVNAVDLGTWKAGFGTSPSATHLHGDADGDGDVDGRDFLIWGSSSAATGRRQGPQRLQSPNPARQYWRRALSRWDCCDDAAPANTRGSLLLSAIGLSYGRWLRRRESCMRERDC
jgi:hypothetical protein